MDKTRSKMFALLIIPLLLIPIIAVGSAHWYDYVYKQYKMHVGRVDSEIITYKVLVPCGEKLTQVWPPDDKMPTKTITISTKVYPGWYCWIGFIIQNQGYFPVWISEPKYDVIDPSHVWPWFTHTEYYYGQKIDGTSYGWERPDVPQSVYAFVKIKKTQPWHVLPPPPGNIPPPVYLEAYGPHTKNSMVMWIKLKLSNNCPSNNFQIQISLTITSTMASPPGP